MITTLFRFLAQNKTFLKAKSIFSHFTFGIYRRLFKLRYNTAERITTTKSLLFLLWGIKGQFVLAILIPIVLEFTNPFFVSLLSSTWFKKFGVTVPNGSDYITFLASVIGVGGVFIGLYYAAIISVCGANYAKVPNNIRGLLAKEQVGNAYMRNLALLTFFSLCLLIFHIVGRDPLILAIPMLLIGAGLMILGFVLLGARTFNLFDPTILSGTIFKRLQQSYKQIQAGGFRWSDKSFQSYFHRVAQESIDMLTAVSNLAADEEMHLSGKPFADLCKNLLIFLRRYEKVKKSIPTNSLWYKQRNVHPDWYRTSDTETSVAYETASGLRPKLESDPKWAESAILPIVKLCLEINIKEKRYAIVKELLSYLDIYVQRLAEEHQVEHAFSQIGEIFSWCEKLIFVEEENLVAKEPLEHMQICELLAMMPINTLLAYMRSIKHYGQKAIRLRINHIKWKSEKSIYRAGFALHILPQLEWMRPILEFEEKVEGGLVSPPWYLQELITQQEVENLRTAMICFCEKVGDIYKQVIETASSTQHPWLKAVIISTESEYWNKFNYHINTLNEIWDDLNSDQRVEGLPWPSLDIDELIEKCRQRDKELLKLMSEEKTLLSLISRPESFPDFAGQFLHAIGEALFAAMCENEFEIVETLFQRYLGCSLLQFEKQRSKDLGTDWQNLNNLKIAAAPLLDLMDISGYVYLLSDYHNAPLLKEPIVKAWNTYLSEASGSQRLQYLARIVSFSEAGIEIEHRSTLRHRWKRIIQKQLRDVKREEVDYGTRVSYILSEPKTVPVHNSPLVRVFARNLDFLFHDGIDIFIAKYVRQREDGENLDFGWKRRSDLEEQIRREENRDATDKESQI